MDFMEKICVIGLGYIGLPTASLLATKGFTVHGVDINKESVAMINCGKVPIVEPSLDILVKSAVHSGNLVADCKPAEADIFIIAVPTPFKENHIPDMSYVEDAVAAIAPYIKPGNLIILESTSPVGTTEMIADRLQKLRADLVISKNNSTMSSGQSVSDFIHIVHCPERVLPGQILKELIENDRIIGGIDKNSAERARLFYKKFVSGNIVITNSRCAELCKLTENAFRDVNIAFANELSLICDELSIDVWELIELANRHPRVNILKPGPGVGGHCIAVDPWFIVDAAPEHARLIRLAREINDSKPGYVITKVRKNAMRFKEPVLACLGLAFKADIDDLRESPAQNIVCKLADEKLGKLLVVEPYIENLPKELDAFQNVTLVDLKTAIAQADIVVLLVDHTVFKEIDSNVLKEKIIIDTRGIWR
jgi:UDP-N-acetyl-D-mannosaminuronic acid dehydrogenase